MKPFKTGAALALALTLCGLTPQVAHAVDVDLGVSIQISQPGVYGRIDIGRYPQPVLVQTRPVLIESAPYHRGEPIYLWVPPGHRAKWGHHCREYRACGVPVYFVEERWYRDHVMRERGREAYREGQRDGYREGRYRDEDRRDDRYDDRRERDRDHDKGRGHGKGRDKGHDRHDRD